MVEHIKELLIVEENEKAQIGLSKALGSFAGVVFVEENDNVLSRLKEHGPCDIIVLNRFKETFRVEPEAFISEIRKLSPGSRIMIFVPHRAPGIEQITMTSLYKMVKFNTI